MLPSIMYMISCWESAGENMIRHMQLCIGVRALKSIGFCPCRSNYVEDMHNKRQSDAISSSSLVKMTLQMFLVVEMLAVHGCAESATEHVTTELLSLQRRPLRAFQ